MDRTILPAIYSIVAIEEKPRCGTKAEHVCSGFGAKT